MVNVGFIKGILPVFDFEKIESKEKNFIQLQYLDENDKRKERIPIKILRIQILKNEIHEIQKRITSGLAINVICDFCDGPVYGKPKILKFADIERFFCCISCKSGYTEKYQGRIESIKRKYEGKSEIGRVIFLFIRDLSQYPYFDGYRSNCCLQCRRTEIYLVSANF